MSLAKILEPPETHKYARVLGVDPSSAKVACSVIEAGKPVATVKIDLGAGDVFQRIHKARIYFPKVLDLYKPQYVAIEQTILIQNPETTRKLSYTVGTLIAECLYRELPVEDVPPATWKSFMGVKPLTKRWKEQILAELGDTEGKKEIARLKKSQLQDKLSNLFPQFDWSDNDIADSTGIGLWCFGRYGIQLVD